MVSREDPLRARHPEDADPPDIHADIDRTRRRMDRTVEEIGHRLHPRTLVGEALGLPAEADGPAGDTLRGVCGAVFQQVRRHPVPVILMSAGLLWLLSEEDEEPAEAPQPKAAGDYEPARRPAHRPAPAPGEAPKAIVPPAVEEPRIEELARPAEPSGQRPRK